MSPPASVDGWLHRLLARELGIGAHDFLDPEQQAIVVAGEPVALTRLEFGVAAYLYANAGTPVSRERLLDDVWGRSYHGGSNVVDAIIKTLRRKLGENGPSIETVRGHGYALRLDS
jgi:DNA-binding response OmpR family regulator